MNTKHSIGPWGISDEKNPLIFNDEGYIAQVLAYSEGTTGNLRVTAYADASLIAAAPELLAALRRLVRKWDSVRTPIAADWAAARAAIAKAEGR